MTNAADTRLRVFDASALTASRTSSTSSTSSVGATDTLALLATGKLHAALVRGVYTPSEVRAVVETLTSGRFGHQLANRDVADGSGPQIRTMGVPISPSDVCPGGPDPDAYHGAAPGFRASAAELFAPAVSFPERATQVLRALSGVPVELPTDDQGRVYGDLTVRCIPPGCGLPPHCENHYMGIPVYAPLRSRVKLDQKLGFFCVLQAAERGGALAVYDDTFVPGEFAFRTRSLDIVPDRAHVLVSPAPGDMVVLGAGARYHQVTRVEGGAVRWTVGGFGAFSLDDTRFYRWA
jgi:hypothetical protein